MASEPDGTLHDWNEIAGEYEWDTLLLGNGLSINIWEPFKYRELYDHAKAGSVLTANDRKLFAGTPNFERVLGDLLTAIRVNDRAGLQTGPLYERYRNIQLALGHAVREVHINRDRVPMDTRRTIRKVIEEFEWVFTTSYDLLAYWAMAVDGVFQPFKDHFRYGSRLEFDPDRAAVYSGEVPIYFLHGALHLIVSGDGVTWKLRRTAMDTLLDQFGQPIPGDAQARPLLVTEGSAVDKLRVIDGNDYLRQALDRLYERDLPVVVFGSGLSQHDAHITDALSEHPARPIAVSMLPEPKGVLLAKQVDIYGRLEADPLIFFNAETHPLGRPGLSVPAP